MRRKRALQFLLVFSTLFVGLGSLIWWSLQRSHDSIILSEPQHTVHGLTIENGSAFDEAAVDVEKYNKLVVPDNAEVRRGGQASKLQIFMKKTLAYYGHPPMPMSIRSERKCMGCALWAEGDSLIVATFGEWDSRIEGGADIHVVVLVPSGIDVEQRAGLSGPESAGRKKARWYLGEHESPAQGWTPVADHPDSDRCAGSLWERLGI